MNENEITKNASEIIANGRAATNTELENEFEFAASEAGYSDEEINEAFKSPWFPWFNAEE